MLTRLVVAIGFLLPLTPHHTSALREAAAQRSGIIGDAARQLAYQPRSTVLTWIGRQPGVISVAVGLDKQTIDIRFADRSEGAILPAIPHATRLASPAPYRPLRASSISARAAVLEPFASELNLGADAGKAEAESLRAAGLGVDVETDWQVNLSIMASLSNYSVVYILTHSGVNPQGEGVIATGELASPDPSVQPLLDDHTVIIVGVAGSTQKYYGVLSGYFSRHLADFPPNSLWFVNGCSMLRGTLVWNALASRGVRAMASWDGEAMANDDDVAARDFFESLASGRSVSQAIADVYTAGHGRSLVGSAYAQLGYVGNASYTLNDVIDPPTATSVPTATATPLPSPTPAPTAGTPAHRGWPTAITWKQIVVPRPSAVGRRLRSR